MHAEAECRFVHVLFAGLLLVTAAAVAESPVVIAHRGASGYLPEHTLESKALAYGLGADYLEQDVVLSADGVPIVLHDLWLEELTDVATVFPERARKDGHWYALDLTLAELRLLRLHERRRPGSTELRWPGRFAADGVGFRIHTLAEELAFTAGLNRSSGRRVGVYTEIKSPAWHRAEGHDITRAVLEVLAEAGYTRRSDHIFLQCFDPRELLRIRFELKSDLKLVQLIAGNVDDADGIDYDAMRSAAGLDAIRRYADGIGPQLLHLASFSPDLPQPRSTGLAALARERGLLVHPYTFRVEQLADHGVTATQLLDWLFKVEGVDGVFSDQPDVIRRYLDQRLGRGP